MLLSRQIFLAFLIGLLLFAGVAQAQNAPGGTTPQNSEMKADANYLQPWQPILNADQDATKRPLQEKRRQSSQPVNVSIENKPDIINNSKKAAGVENTGHKSDLLKPTIGNNRVSITPKMGPHAAAVGSSPTIRGSNQSPAPGTSFLDGYLLKSLQDKGIGRRKDTQEKESKDDLPQKKAKRAY